MRTIRNALNSAAGRPEHAELDADEGAHALAAAEVVATAYGKIASAEGVLDGVLAWAAAHPDAGAPKIRALARSAVKRTTDNHSELHDLWADSGELRGWLLTTESLILRLSP